MATSAADAYTVGLLLADARLPSGGHVSSSGLEPALLAGLRPQDVEGYMRDRADTAATVDAGTAVVSCRMLSAAEPGRGAAAAAAGDESTGDILRTQIRQLIRAWAARTPGAAARQISYELGRGLIRLASSLWPEAQALSVVNAPAPRPVVLGAIAAHAGLPAQQLARLVIYDDTASAAAALLKLEPGDPAEAMAMALRACSSVEHKIPDLAVLTHHTDIPYAGAPLSEDWTERHAQNPRRLFRA